MTLERFLMYRNESLLEIILAYIKDGAGGSLDPVLKVAIVTLNNDMVNFRKLFASLPPVDKSTPAPSSCTGCDKSKKQYEEAKSKNPIEHGKMLTGQLMPLRATGNSTKSLMSLMSLMCCPQRHQLPVAHNDINCLNDINDAVEALKGGKTLTELTLDPDFMQVVVRHMQYFRSAWNTILSTRTMEVLRATYSIAVFRP
jgi:hypothetical protein